MTSTDSQKRQLGEPLTRGRTRVLLLRSLRCVAPGVEWDVYFTAGFLCMSNARRVFWCSNASRGIL